MNRRKIYVYKTLFWMLLVTGASAILLYCFSTGISGNDFWWHAKTGEWICSNRAIPNKDIYSWYGVEHGFDWVAHEWLSEVIFWKLYQVCGDGGIYLFCLGLAALMILLLMFQIREYITENCLLSVFYICMFCVVSSLFFYGRPQIFAFFLLYGELYCLYKYDKGRNTWCIYLIPAIALLWSNLHGGSSNLAYILILSTLLGGIKEWRIGRVYSEKWPLKKIVKMIVVLALTVAAIFVNPVGGRQVFLYPYTNMADTIMLHVVSEWTAPDAKNVGEIICYFIPVFLLCFGILFGKRDVKLRDALIMLLFMLLFFRSARFIIWFYISASFWAFPYGLSCRMKNPESILEKAILVCFSILLAAGCCIGAKGCFDVYKNGNAVTRMLEESVLETVREEAPVRLFNDYNFGGALIYADIPVFIDGRADVYSQNGLLGDGISLMLMQQVNSEAETMIFDPEELIDRYNFDGFLIDAGRPLYAYLNSHEERYEKVLVTETAAYFRRLEQQ
ncbi:MAG: hypothetical protein K2O06_14490 [Acetatifactor sp.]|nr:hypothetical protein [Acetatifactor sp.]